MADLVHRTHNPRHNQAKWSFFIAQRNNLNQTSPCRTFRLFKQRFWGSFETKIERKDDKEFTCTAIPCAQDCDKKWTFSCEKTLMAMEHIFPDPFRDSRNRLSAFFVSVNSLSTIIKNGLLFCSSRTCVPQFKGASSISEVSIALLNKDPPFHCSHVKFS